jgi:uncharacterized membrane protein
MAEVETPIVEPRVERDPVVHERVVDERPHRPGAASEIHRFLGGFPTAFFTLALITDIEYLNTANLMWQYFSIWLLVAALITGGLAVLAGIVDFATGGARGRRGAWWHFGLTFLAMLVGLWNAFVHSRDGWTAVAGTGIILSVVTVVLLYAGGFIGALIDRPARTRDVEVQA